MNDSIRARPRLPAPSTVAETVAEVKPQLRGWLHPATAPLTLAAGIVLIALSPTAATRLGSAVFVVSSRAAVHASRRSTTAAAGRRAVTGRPAALRPRQHLPADRRHLHAVQPPAAAAARDRVVLLSVVWAGALLGVRFRVFWIDAPRWLLHRRSTSRSGWAAVFVLPAVRRRVRAARRRHRHRGAGADRGRRRALHARRRRLRLPSARPVAALVRLPRGVPHRSRSWRSSPTTSASRSRRTPCAERRVVI